MSGLSFRISSKPSPQLSITRELKFSSTTSDTEMSCFTMSRPRGERTLTVRLSLLQFVSLKLPLVLRFTSRPWGVVKAPPLPRSLRGHSTFITSAPSVPSHRAPHGPARTHVKSTTRTPFSAPGASTAFANVSTIAHLRSAAAPAFHRCGCRAVAG